MMGDRPVLLENFGVPDVAVSGLGRVFLPVAR
jgi:hypothetical protein